MGPAICTLLVKGFFRENVADLLNKTISHVGDTCVLNVAIIMRCADVREHLQHIDQLEKFIAVTCSQEADNQAIKDAYHELSSAQLVVPSTGSDDQDCNLVQHGFEVWATFAAKVQPWVPAATAAMLAYSKSRASEAAGAANSVAEKLAEIAGGMSDGSGWLDLYDGSQDDGPALQDHMKRTLFKQIGISNQIKNLVRELTEKRVDFADVCRDFGVRESDFADDRLKWEAAPKRSNVTVSVASLAQAVAAKGASANDAIARAIDAMTAKSVAVDEIPTGLWAEVQRRLAA